MNSLHSALLQRIQRVYESELGGKSGIDIWSIKELGNIFHVGQMISMEK